MSNENWFIVYANGNYKRIWHDMEHENEMKEK